MIVPTTGYKIEGYSDQTLGFSEAFICLYMPLLGADATVLYQFLSIHSGEQGTHHRFMQHFGWTLSHLQKEREKLEALHLLKTYQADDHVEYVIKAPISYTQFFSHPLFSALLLKTVGDVHFEYLQSKYQVNERHTNEVTKSFSDVFGKIEPLDTKVEPTVQSIEPSFDWELFDALTAKSFIRSHVIESSKQMIASKAYVFQKSEEEMARIIIEAYDVTKHELNEKRIEAMLLTPTTAKKQKPKEQILNGGNDYEEIAQFFEATPPQQFLQARFGHVSKNDLSIIDMLMSQFQFSRGVANVIIDFVLNTNDQKLTRAYVETIASQLYRKKITTALDAIRHFLHIREAKKQAPSGSRGQFNKKVEPKAHQELIDFDAVETKTISEEEKARFIAEFGGEWNENA